MPIYDVIKPGYMNDIYHKPDDPKHDKVVTDKPLKHVPSWLRLRGEKSKPETKAQRTARLKKEAAEAEAIEQDKDTAEATSFAADVSDQVTAGSAITTI